MGKIRRVRHKYHLATNKKTSSESVPEKDFDPETPPTLLPVPDNPFLGLDISLDKLEVGNTKALKDCDVRSVISAQSTSTVNTISKKEKRKIRHETFLKKLEAAYLPRKINAKKKSKSVQHSKPLADKLPNLQLNLEQPKEKKKKLRSLKKRGIPKAKYRNKALLKGVSEFQNLLKDPEFKLDPFQAVTSRVQVKAYESVDMI